MVNERNRSQEDERICKAVERMKWRNRMKCTSYSPGDGETGERVNPEDLNTGPDTTENIEEQHEMTFESCRTLANFVADNPAIIPVSVADDGTSIRLTYKNSKNMDNRFKYEPDPEDPGKMRRVNCRPEAARGEKPTEEEIDAAWTPMYDPETYKKIGLVNDLTGERKYMSDEERMNLEAGWYAPKYYDPRDYENGGKGSPKPLGEIMESPSFTLGPNPVITPGAETIDDIMEAERLNLGRGRLTPERDNKNVSPGDKPADYYHYGRILERMDDTHRRKNGDYGDAAYKGYKKYGDYYFLVQLHNKLTRLENLTINNTKPQVEDESVDDTLLDMANYAVMYLESRHRDD